MVRIHETWREEVGWVLIMGGFAGVEYGLINIMANLGYPDSRGLSLLIMAACAVAFVAGLALHMTRPSKRRTQGDASTETPTGETPPAKASVQHA